MRSRTLAAALFLVANTTVGSLGVSGDRGAAARQSAVINLTEPTLIGGTIVQGPVLFVHDDTAPGPCTTVCLFEPSKGPSEEIAAFHCIPTARRIVDKFTVRTRPSSWGYGVVLTEFQFAGETEGHGVPIPADVH